MKETVSYIFASRCSSQKLGQDTKNTWQSIYVKIYFAIKLQVKQKIRTILSKQFYILLSHTQNAATYNMH